MSNALGPLDPSKLDPQTDTLPRINSSTSQDLAQPNFTASNVNLEPSRFQGCNSTQAQSADTQAYQVDVENKSIVYQFNDQRADFFAASGNYCALIMPDQSNPDSAAFIVANTQGLGAGGKLSLLKEGPLSMTVREGISQLSHSNSRQLQSQVQCKLYAPEGFKIVFSEQADSAVVGSLMQVRRILESGKPSGGGLPDIICDTPEQVKISTTFRDMTQRNLQQVWLTLSVDGSANMRVHQAGESCDIEFRPNNADGIVNFGISFETTEPCPIAMPKENIFRSDFLSSVQDDPIAQQELLSFSLLTPEIHQDLPELNGPRAGAPRFLSPFGRDGIIGALSFLPVMQPKAAVAVGVLPHLARVLVEAKDGIPAGTACHEVVKDIVDGREVLLPNYIMVDTAPLLTMLIGEVLKNPACKTELLNHLDQPITLNQSNGNSESGNTYRNQLERLLCHIVKVVKPFALSPDNPLLLPRFN